MSSDISEKITEAVFGLCNTAFAADVNAQGYRDQVLAPLSIANPIHSKQYAELSLRVGNSFRNDGC